MKKSKLVVWMCDYCDNINYREVPVRFIINDDTCDKCHKNIHEPNLEIVTNNNRN